MKRRMPSVIVVAETVSVVGGLLASTLSAHAIVNSRLLRKPGHRMDASPNLVPDSVSDSVPWSVSVGVPARNEESNIHDCVRSILASTGLPNLDVTILNDASADSTGEIAALMATQDPRLRVVEGSGDVPAGWIGKTNASQQLVAAMTGDYFVFVDADVRLQPHAIASSIVALERYGLDLVSPYPRQVAVSPAERFVQPLLQWLWLTFLPLRLAERKRPASMVAANGQFMVGRRAAFEAVGGFARVKGEVLDDVALARVLKAAGFRVAILDGTNLASCRMYQSWSELRDGYTKNLWSASGNRFAAGLFGSLLIVAYLVPPVAAIVGSTGFLRRTPHANRRRLATVAGIGGAGTAAGFVGRIVSARTMGGRVGDSAGHPVSILMLLSLLVRSWRHHRRGTISWKGRLL